MVALVASENCLHLILTCDLAETSCSGGHGSDGGNGGRGGAVEVRVTEQNMHLVYATSWDVRGGKGGAAGRHGSGGTGGKGGRGGSGCSWCVEPASCVFIHLT